VEIRGLFDATEFILSSYRFNGALKTDCLQSHGLTHPKSSPVSPHRDFLTKRVKVADIGSTIINEVKKAELL